MGDGFRVSDASKREMSARRRISALQHPCEIELVVVLARDEVDGAVVAHGQIVVAVRLGRVVTAKIWETNMQGVCGVITRPNRDKSEETRQKSGLRMQRTT